MTWLAVVVGLVLATGSVALAALEAAFYLFRQRHLGHLTHQDRKAELVNSYLDDPAALLMPVHIGTYTAHVALTVIITALLLDLLGHWAALVALVAMLVYLLACRLMLPYALVRADPERALLRLVPAFHVYATLLGPVVRSVRRRIGWEVEAELAEPPAATPEVPPPPVHEVDAIRVANSLVRFSETQVREVMTPRPDIEAIAAGATVTDLRGRFRQSVYSRMPVYEENLDDIVGVVTVRDLVQYEGDPEAPVRGLARPVFLAPETQRIPQLLKELQARGTTLAVVIDEYGGTAGLVSVEDIVEELVGEIKDEYDVETEPIVVEPDGSVLVAGRVSLDRLEEALEIGVEDDSDVDTVGGLATTVFGRIPEVGETVAYQGFTIEVVEAERKRVNRLRFRRVSEPPPE
jgi:CBS domain containing-hemolysin-like protein